MTDWRVVNAEILDVRADGLICSANPSLNLSGGVGGALLLRYGSDMQDFLHSHLRVNGLHFIEPGNSVVAPACRSPFLSVAHAVAIDAFYQTNPNLIRRAYESALEQLQAANCRSVVASCLGCGYGRCSLPEFVKSLQAVVELPFPTLDTVIFATTNLELVEAIETATRIQRHLPSC